MNIFDILMEEHDQLLALGEIMKKIALSIFKGSEPPTEDIRKIIKLLRDYAHQEHHFKEEQILYQAMLDHIPNNLSRALIENGMLTEHDQSIYTMMSLETANNRYVITPNDELKLEIIVYLMNYANLLISHIGRENSAAYPFGIRELKPHIMDQLNLDAQVFLEKEESQKRRRESISLFKELSDTWSETNPSNIL